MAIEKRDKRVSLGEDISLPEDSDFRVRYPLIYEFLSATTYSDGSKRRTSTLTLFLDAGGLKVSLNDRDQDFVAFVTADGLVSVLDALEAALEADSLDWRKSGGSPWKGKKGT